VCSLENPPFAFAENVCLEHEALGGNPLSFPGVLEGVDVFKAEITTVTGQGKRSA